MCPAGITTTSYAPFLPTNISGCKAWFRADLGITISTGVSSWADQSGNGNNLVQATGSAQPTLNKSDSVLNGQSSISSIAASSQTLALASFVLAQPYTIFLVGYAANGQNAACSGGTGGSHYFGVGSSNIAFAAVSNQINAQLTNTANASLMAATCNGVSSVVYGNSFSNSNAGNAGTTAFSIFETHVIDDVSFYTSTIAEIIIYSGVLTNPQLQSVFSYATSRYNIGSK